MSHVLGVIMALDQQRSVLSHRQVDDVAADLEHSHRTPGDGEKDHVKPVPPSGRTHEQEPGTCVTTMSGVGV